jgi:DnaK suppressor protein
MTDHLSEDVVKDLRQELEQQRAKITNDNKKALDNLRVDQDRGGRDSVDESNEEVDKATTLRLSDRNRKYLTKINTALERIEDGVYGYCVECEEPIPEKRLKARPAAIFCIDCKEEREKAENRKKKRPGLLDNFDSL